MTTLTCCILAGGWGTRLYPHSRPAENQKPLLVMGSPDRRLIDFAIDASGPAQDVLLVSNGEPERAELVEHYTLRRPGIVLLRDKRCGSAGPLVDQYWVFAGLDPDGDVALLPADHVHEGLNLAALHAYHRQNEADVTLLAVSPKEYGEYVEVCEGLAVRIVAAPGEGLLSTAGTYVMKVRYLTEWIRQRVRHGREGEVPSLYRDLICPAVAGDRVAVYELPEGGYWDDAGTLGRYWSNNMRLSGGRPVISLEASVGPEARVERSVVLGGVALDGNSGYSRAIISCVEGRIYATVLA